VQIQKRQIWLNNHKPLKNEQWDLRFGWQWPPKVVLRNWHSVVQWTTGNILKAPAASNTMMDYYEDRKFFWNTGNEPWTTLGNIPQKRSKVCWISKTVIFQLLSMMLKRERERERERERTFKHSHSIVPCGYDNTGLTENSSCLFDTLNAYMQHPQCSVRYLWFLLCQQEQYIPTCNKNRTLPVQQ